MSRAVDLEFGADALPVLIDDSDLVLQTGRIETLQARRASVTAYRTTVDAAISGRAEPGSRVILLAPQSLELPPGTLAANNLLFLAGPVDTQTAASFVDSANVPVFWLVSGNYGRIAATPDRLAAIRAYEGFAADERKASWVRDQLRNDDELLQRSALFELSKTQYANEGEKFELLRSAALDAGTAGETKDLALQLLEVSGSPRALIPLRDIVVSEIATAGHRAVAMRAIARIDGGEAVLRELEQSPDRTINGPARTELELLQGTSASSPTTASVVAGLTSADVQIRAQAIQDLKTLRPSPDTLARIAPLLEPSATTTFGERAALIDYVTSLNDAEAAALLENVARDGSQNEDLRSAAIIGLGLMNASVSSGSLRSLASELEDGDLKDLVGTLAE